MQGSTDNLELDPRTWRLMAGCSAGALFVGMVLGIGASAIGHDAHAGLVTPAAAPQATEMSPLAAVKPADPLAPDPHAPILTY